MSLFEQYEQAAQKSADLIVSNRFPGPELVIIFNIFFARWIADPIADIRVELGF